MELLSIYNPIIATFYSCVEKERSKYKKQLLFRHGFRQVRWKQLNNTQVFKRNNFICIQLVLASLCKYLMSFQSKLEFKGCEKSTAGFTLKNNTLNYEKENFCFVVRMYHPMFWLSIFVIVMMLSFNILNFTIFSALTAFLLKIYI